MPLPLAPAHHCRPVSRASFVQDLPPGLLALGDIVDSWGPAPLPFASDTVCAGVRELSPTADFSDLCSGRVQLPGSDLDVNLGKDAPLRSFALHIRASDNRRARRCGPGTRLRRPLPGAAPVPLPAAR